MTRRDERGFSLLEMLAAVAIMAGTLLVFFDLIDHSMRVFAESDSAARSTLTVAAESTLREDVQLSVGLPETGTESTGVLELELGDGRRVSWRRDGGALVRTEDDGAGGPAETRAPARGVTGWRWIVVGPALLEVRFDLAVAPAMTGLRQTSAADDRMRRKKRVLLLSPRGSKGDGSW